MANYADIKKVMTGAIIISIFILTFFILKPIIIPIILGLLFAYIFNPIYKKINKRIKNNSISAFIVLAGLVMIVVIPIIYIVPSLVKQLFGTYVLLQNFNFGEYIGNIIQSDISSALAINLDNIIGKIFSTSLNQFTNVLVNLPSMLLQFVVFFFTFYFAIRDADKLWEYISTLSPFSKKTEKKILKEFRGITNAIVFGQIFIGVVQGLALGVGLFFLGVSNVLVLTFITCIVSMFPVLGSWLVWFPVSIFLLISGKTVAGIFLLLYGGLFISSIDNFIRPYILSKQSNLPVALSLISTIGGLYFFGITGLLLGPLTIAYVLIIVEFYRHNKLKELFNE